MAEQDPAVQAAMDILRAEEQYLKGLMIAEILARQREHDEAEAVADADKAKRFASAAVRWQVNLYRRLWGEEPDLGEGQPS